MKDAIVLTKFWESLHDIGCYDRQAKRAAIMAASWALRATGIALCEAIPAVLRTLPDTFTKDDVPHAWRTYLPISKQ